MTINCSAAPPPTAIPEDLARLQLLQAGAPQLIHDVIAALRRDQVVLVDQIPARDADGLLASVASAFDLRQQLATQAAFASLHRHRINVGDYFMSVNARADYEFIPAHSEGQRATNMQLASFYCYENSSDGGASVLLNAAQDSPEWHKLRELVCKVDLGGRQLSMAEVAAAKSMYQINLPEDLLQSGDTILSERGRPLPGVVLYNVLAPLQTSYSRILERQVHAYWDNVASTDIDASQQYFDLLNGLGLLKTPPSGASLATLDNAYKRRVWRSGMRYNDMFQSRLTLTLAAQQLIIMNNMTWAHSAANWTPGVGRRQVVAAFA